MADNPQQMRECHYLKEEEEPTGETTRGERTRAETTHGMRWYRTLYFHYRTQIAKQASYI